MDFYTKLVSGVLFPLHERLKHHSSVAVRRHMEQSQWWDAERLRAYQLERLRTLLKRAAEKVPYYRRVFSELDFHAGDLRSLDDLRRLPLLTKEVIRQNADDMKASDAVGLARFNTGGSSGEPLVFHIGNERVSHDVAAKWRATRWWDVDIGDREIVVWGSPVELGSQDRVRALRDRLFRSRLIPAFDMSPRNLDRFVEEIHAFRPAMLFGYPSSLSRIGQHALDQGVDLSRRGIRVAFVTSERLYDEQKAVIERAFGCPVANGYGGRDAGFIAHACPQGNMHITAEDIIVEILDRDGQAVAPGESGEIVVTHLATGDYPFIRYRTGDIGALGEGQCACGRGLPILEKIEGRSTDFVIAKDGTLMHGLALIYVIRDEPGVQRFKIVQESVDRTRVYLVTDADFDADVRNRIEAGLKQRLGESVEIDIQAVDEIPAEKSGKFRYIVSHAV